MSFHIPEIYFLCRIRTTFLHRTTQTVWTCCCRFVWLFEMLQRSKGLDTDSWPLSHPVVDEVHVMTTLCHQRERVLRLISPVTTDKTVSKVPEANILSMVDCHHLTNGSTVNDLLDLDHRWKVSEHVTYSQHHTTALTLSCYLLTVWLWHCHGFLYQNMIAKLGKCNCRFLKSIQNLYDLVNAQIEHLLIVN